MRVEEFRAWTTNFDIAESTIRTHITDIKRIEKSEGIDVDNEFKKDGMKSLLQTYTYSVQDERDGRPNPTKLITKTTSLPRFLGQYKSYLNKYREFCLSEGDDFVYEEQENNADSDASETFGLEADLQNAIRENITQLEPKLTIIDGGIERKVASGFIDILARDSKGCLVVIELKAGTARDAVIAQILGYMGDIAEEENKPVRGIIVAADFNQRVQSAARAISNLELKTYRYNFEFN